MEDRPIAGAQFVEERDSKIRQLISFYFPSNNNKRLNPIGLSLYYYLTVEDSNFIEL
ncbi:hypothetical protein [Ignatzschineria sp. F8392]|uniref:hypothetical protein n=1 Tax=Ignatzschineria sp. F8392 TaxID=1980117 RepID=UPI001303BD59|nr:hypothetical protein [Ignatzschineria sp. F8392]